MESAGAQLVAVPARLEDFQIDFAALEAALSPQVKGVIINSPNNPTGVVYSQETIRRLAQMLGEKSRAYGCLLYTSAQGHPVLGDPVYNGLRKGFPELAGQCLHARRLSFQHPRTGERMTLSSPLPAYFQTVLTRCSRLV